MNQQQKKSGALPPTGGLPPETVVQLEKMMSAIDSLKDDMSRMLSSQDDVRRDLANLKDGQRRQETRLSAIESFPRLGQVSQPSRLYGTQAQSVSSPKRVRTGYAG